MKLIKVSHIALAVAAAFAAGAAQSAQTIWSAGASAPTKAQFLAFKSNCLSTGIVDVYMSGTPAIPALNAPLPLPGDAKTGNYFAYQCTFGGIPQANVYPNEVITFFHTVEGGSFNAFVPTPGLMRLSATSVTPTGCTTLPLSTSNPNVRVHITCPASAPTTSPTSPDGGFADVEATMWPDLIGSGTYTWKPANVSQMFGVVVSDALYTAMQTKQLADPLPGAAGLGLPGLPGCTPAMIAANPFAAGPCQPSISPDQYRSIISVEGSGPWQTDWQPLVGAAGASHVVNLCRRVDTSGTQASSNVFFLENPCRQWPTQIGQLHPQTKTATNANYIVTEGPGTGDVKTCLNNANNNATVNNRFAIGVMSMENIPSATDKFHFVKINGASGNLDAKQRAAGAKGVYPFVMETVYTARVAARQAFFDEIASDLADPQYFTEAGLFVLPTAPLAGAPDGDVVGYGTKFGNNCQPQQLFAF